ncbi:MAG: DUF4388 domain-containing protein [Deltaproteobacteria bacterium]|nr:DUF4388 domain-containing protein [Deltaproteobacteria bacterium]
MSLVGSLEDLGLGDILQIVHLSGKSGVLALRGDVGEGQIVFERGLVRVATTRDLPQDLRELLARRKAIEVDALADAAREARKRSLPLSSVLFERALIETDPLEELRAQAVADAVMAMFRWRAGEFSFEVREGAAGADDLALARGLNPQFLALESARESDENVEDEDDSTATVAAPPLGPEDDPFADPPPPVAAVREPAAAAVEEALSAEIAEAEPVVPAEIEPEPTFEPEPAPRVEAAPQRASAPAPSLDESLRESEPQPVADSAPPAQPPPVIAIDASLAVLEWVKSALAGYARIHAFQHTELGIQRIRQYLLRRELPLVLIGANAPPDPISGARDVYDVAARLRRQAPRLPIVVLTPAGARPPARRRTGAAPSAFVERPKDGALSDSRRGAERLELAAALRSALEALPDASSLAATQPAPSRAALPQGDLARLREASSRLRERAHQGEVLTNVLSFAAQSFSRVALFMVRDETLAGIAQLGLAKVGGPDDAALREVQLPLRESAWVRRVLDTLAPVRGRPTDEGDQRLCVMLGNDIPREAFLAPIESANRVVAILYADNLPGGLLLPETGALEVVLHEAGLALDRSLLERALSETTGAATR